MGEITVIFNRLFLTDNCNYTVCLSGKTCDCECIIRVTGRQNHDSGIGVVAEMRNNL